MLFFHIRRAMNINDFLVKWRVVPIGIVLVSAGLLISDMSFETGFFSSITPVIVLIVTNFITLPLYGFILLLMLFDDKYKSKYVCVDILRAIMLGLLTLIWLSMLVPMFLIVFA